MFPRLSLLSPAGLILGLLVSGSASPAVEYFPPEQVRLLDGPFLRAQSVLRDHLLQHDVHRFLAPFRREAGLEPKAAPYPNWESSGLDGHSAGHYLTALAQLSAATGDPEITRRLDLMLAELEAIQVANGDGYLGGVPGGREMWARIRRGEISAESFGLNGGWVPWYNLHKTFAGLRKTWELTHDPRAKAMFLRFCDWCDALVAGLTDEQMEIMLRTEHGGMAEVLADAYALSGEAKYLELARRFSHRAILDPLLRQQDQLTGLHANTQIPKATGFARIGELAGDPAWIEAAQFFWETVVTHRSVAIGGNSVREHFHARDDFTPMIESREGPETCNTYNMLRLTEQLFRGEPRAAYADYYERALYNHILSTQHPEHGGFVYFTPMRPRDYRVYSQAEECFWCCVGTGMENHGRYQRFVYSHDDDNLWVNLFIPSELVWRDHDLTLRQVTRFPDEPRTRLEVTLQQPRRFGLHLRWPGWVAPGDFVLRVNGETQRLDGEPGSYVVVQREWRSGDVVEVDLPLRPALERLPDGSPYVAVRHGPIVLAARTGDEQLDGLIAGDGRMAHVAPGPLRPLDGAPMLVGSEAELLQALRPVEGESLTFTLPGAIRPEAFSDLRLEPFFRMHDTRYVIYWRQTSAEAYPELVREIEARERERMALEERTLDHVSPGQQQPEVEHAYAGSESFTGINRGRSWRSARGWFSYMLQGDPSVRMQLQITVWDGQWGDREFSIMLNDALLSDVSLKSGSTERFREMRFDVPPALVAPDGRMEVKFIAKPGSEAGAIYDVRLIR